MWNKIKAFFQRKPKQEAVEPVPFRVEGVEPAPLTPVPDDAEKAAEALLESLAGDSGSKSSKGSRFKKSKKSDGRKKKGNGKHQTSDIKPQPSKEYYQHLSERIREDREMEARLTTRFVAYCEQELKNPRQSSTANSQLSILERDLLQRMDIVEREGGELKRRWQRCLAEVTVRQLGVRDEE